MATLRAELRQVRLKAASANSLTAGCLICADDEYPNDASELRRRLDEEASALEVGAKEIRSLEEKVAALLEKLCATSS